MAAAQVVRSLALAALLVPSAAAAQLQAGQRLRIQTSAAGAPLIGTLVATAADSLFVRTPDGVRSVAAHAVHRLDVSHGQGHTGRRGAILGAALGAVPAALWSVIASPTCTLNVRCLVEHPRREFVLGALLGAGIGAGVGYFIGAAQRGERWQSTPLDVALTPSSIQLSVSF